MEENQRKDCTSRFASSTQAERVGKAELDVSRGGDGKRNGPVRTGLTVVFAKEEESEWERETRQRGR